MTTLIWQYMLIQNIYFVQQICSITYLFLLSFHSLRMISRSKKMSLLCKSRLIWGSGFGVGLGGRRFYIRSKKMQLMIWKIKAVCMNICNFSLFFSLLQITAVDKQQLVSCTCPEFFIDFVLFCLLGESGMERLGLFARRGGLENNCWSST